MDHLDRRAFLAGTVAATGLTVVPAHAGTIGDLAADIVIATRFQSAGIPVRSFSIPSTSMMPTVPKGNVVLADLRLAGRKPQRGDIVVFNRPDNVVYLRRVLALPGDRIAFANWVPTVNGVAATWSRLDPITVETKTGPVTYPIVEERFRGEAPYRIALLPTDDSAESLANIPEHRVGPDEVYVVGDNRCNSFDSRLSGWEATRPADMVGRVVYRLRPEPGWLVPKTSVPGYPF